MRARELAMILGVMLVGTLAVAAPAQAATPAGGQLNVTPGLKGFDSLNVETPAQIACLSAAGYSFDVVNTNDRANESVHWYDEYNAAAAAGMDVLLFQGYDRDSWNDLQAAKDRAGSAVTKANAVGYPKGSQIFLNLEDNTNSTASTAIQWVTNWANAIRAAGYTPGVYVGVPQILTAAQVNALPVSVFWRSASSSAPQASAGFVVRQTAVSRPACGINGGVDTDVTSQDIHGNQAKGVGFPATPATPTAAGAFVAVSPTRLLDTRPSRVSPTGTYTLTVAGRAGVPANASAAVLNVTAVAPTAAGNLAVYPDQPARPNSSNVNFVTGQTVANLVTVPLGSDGKVVLANNSTGSTQLLVDIQGYYLGGTPTVAGSFQPLNPKRLLDTRPGSVPPAQTRQLNFSASTGVPSGASAVVLNVTAVAPTRPGNISVYPNGTGSGASNLNFVAGQTVPNLVTVPLGTGNAIVLANNSTGSTQLLVDVEGYYLPGAGTLSGTFVPVAPTRLLDTRQTGVPLGPVAGQALRLPGSAATAGAVVANLTVTGPTAAGHLTAFPTGINLPGVSNVNFNPQQTVANLSTVPVGRDGAIVLANGSTGYSNVIVDLFGYFHA